MNEDELLSQQKCGLHRKFQLAYSCKTLGCSPQLEAWSSHIDSTAVSMTKSCGLCNAAVKNKIDEKSFPNHARTDKQTHDGSTSRVHPLNPDDQDLQ
jgi:hypothetical protein